MCLFVLIKFEFCILKLMQLITSQLIKYQFKALICIYTYVGFNTIILKIAGHKCSSVYKYIQTRLWKSQKLHLNKNTNTCESCEYNECTKNHETKQKGFSVSFAFCLKSTHSACQQQFGNCFYWVFGHKMTKNGFFIMNETESNIKCLKQAAYELPNCCEIQNW